MPDAWRAAGIVIDPMQAVAALFDREWYLTQYADVRAAGVDPLQHYLIYGASEGRDPHILFDSDWYLLQYPDVAAGTQNPLIHYMWTGAWEGRDPHPLFDDDWYLAKNPELFAMNVNPLLHFIRIGAAQGRDPHPFFDMRGYVSRLGEDAAEAQDNPLVHYIRSGALNGWRLPTVTDAEQGRTELGPAGGISPMVTLLARDARPGAQRGFTRFYEKFPIVMNQYTRMYYLSFIMPVIDRAECFKLHYNYFLNTLSDDAIEAILLDEYVLFEQGEGESLYRITLQSSRDIQFEGDLSLYIWFQGEPIYVLGFSFVPGHVVGLTDRAILLMSRLQGFRRFYPLIKQATKAMRDVAPSAVLMAALQGIAMAIGLVHVAAVRSTSQPAWRPQYHEILQRAYDRHFAEIGGTLLETDYFVWDIPLPEKPLDQVKADHRLRTKTKRKVKAEVTQAVRAAWAKICL